MRAGYLIASTVLVVLLHSSLTAQSSELPKVELGAEFSTLNRDDFAGARLEPGAGARFTFNLNKNFALESAGYLFPRRCFTCAQNGMITEVVGGVKAGKRFQSWGIFAKARPGIVNFSEGQTDITTNGNGSSFPFEFRRRSLTNFATDLGGVLEFYPSKRIVTRFDAGDTLIHFRRRTTNAIVFDPATSGYKLTPFTMPAKTTHNFQFSAGVGFRF